MAKMINWLSLKRLTLRNRSSYYRLTLIAVLVVITLEFRWAESIRLRFAGYSSVNDWFAFPRCGCPVNGCRRHRLMGACFIGGN